jgi:hypothetical protein
MNGSIEPRIEAISPAKRCTACGETKAHPEFFSVRHTPSGLSDRCRSCVFAAARHDRADRERRRYAQASNTR